MMILVRALAVVLRVVVTAPDRVPVVVRLEREVPGRAQPGREAEEGQKQPSPPPSSDPDPRHGERHYCTG